MSQLVSPRPRVVTAAAILTAATGLYWFGTGVLSLLVCLQANYRIRVSTILELIVFPGCLGVAGLVAFFALWLRQNWGRILAVALSVPSILFGLSYLRPFLNFNSSIKDLLLLMALFAFPIIAGFAILPLLAGEKIRQEMLPPAIVSMYVNLLDEGAPCARPTRAVALGGGLFELLATEDYDPNEEHWEISPGSVVRGVESDLKGETHLSAVALGS